MNGNPSDQIFRGLRTPELPDDLPPLVLARARVALRAQIQRPDIWDRVRNNRGLQLAWAASVGALCFANLLVGGQAAPGSKAETHRPVAAKRMIEPEIQHIVDLPPLKIAADDFSSVRDHQLLYRPGMENPS